MTAAPDPTADPTAAPPADAPADTHGVQPLRAHEVRHDGPLAADAAVAFIGRIRTPWARREDCPRQGSLDGPECRIEVFAPWDAALDGIERFERIETLYWLHRSRRDLLRQNPDHGDGSRGTFSLRSPVRPNPIATAMVALVRREGATLVVRGLDCIDGTPLLDLKPDRCAHSRVSAPAR